MQVVGVDATMTPKGWVAVVLHVGGLHRVGLYRDLGDLLAEHKYARAIGVNLPMGHDDPDGARNHGIRACDQAAARWLGPHGDLVQPVAPLHLFDQPGLGEAQREARERGWPDPGPHWRHRERILEVNRLAAVQPRFVEVHPEVSFTAMLREQRGPDAGLERRPSSWAGQVERLGLLHRVGLRPVRSLGGVGRANPEDLLGATAIAWTAHRCAKGRAQTLPEPAADGRASRPFIAY